MSAKKALTILVLFLMVQANALAQNVAPFLVKVSSQYKDELLSSQYKNELQLEAASKTSWIHGTGFVVRYKNRSFVVTASHVSQGEQLKLNFVSAPAQRAIVNRYRSPDSDLEIIEIENSSEAPALEYEHSNFVFQGPPLSMTSFRYRAIDKYNLVPLLLETVDPHVVSDNEFVKNEHHSLRLDIFAHILHSPALIQMGTSGSPLLAVFPLAESDFEGRYWHDQREGLIKTEKWQLRGVAIRRDRFFADAEFVPVHKVHHLLQSVVTNAYKEPPNLPQWHLKGKLMYRTKGSLSESAYLKGVSGNGVSMDGGDLAFANENSPNDFYKEVSPYPLVEERTVFLSVFAQRSLDNQLISFPLWFDMEYSSQLGGFTFHLNTEQAFSVVRSYLFKRLVGSALVHDFQSGCKSTLIWRGNKSQIHVALENGDGLNFAFDEQGRIEGGEGEHFRPVVELQSKQGKGYIVDLRPLFFADVSRIHTPYYSEVKFKDATLEERRKWNMEAFNKYLRAPYLRFRPKSAKTSLATLAELRSTKESLEGCFTALTGP